jgi:hypothetical protein
MTKLMEKALEAVRGWPQDRQDEAATRLPLALDQLGPAPYRTSDEELRAIDEALEEIARGERATADEVKAAYARFRR